ncbi:DUF1758 domain-containing protein [Trichonephila inaurata madagascariensis]|uniref:DUF1758 domain-containing protein n=1 Tax=Trichonephila inaurata madagascariensis TaxID=2747483 RepID=A0A8X6WTL4_9ARAC|nr:DUF1758 domain-containing protein [Trichonephila inaurata madagascariensis]
MIPHHDLDSSMRELFGDISLADPAFYKSGPVDVLLGVDLTLPLLKGQTLPLGKDKPFAIRSELGWIFGDNSKQNAIRRLISVERHLISNPDKYNLYRNFLKEYLDLKHMELVPDSEINNVKSLYLPHHGVKARDTSCTTKLHKSSLTPPLKPRLTISQRSAHMVGPRMQTL